MIDDKIFVSLDFQRFQVTSKDISKFLDAIQKNTNSNVFVFETDEGFFKVDKVNRVFRVLKRKEKFSLEQYHDSDFVVMAMYKIAKRSGFKCYLENKYMN
jgi:hypothetical protein